MQLAERYEVEKAPDGATYKRKVARYNKTKKTVEYEEVEAPMGYIVHFPRGHTLHVRDDAHLARLGFDKPAGMTDLDGDVDDSEATGMVTKPRGRRSRASYGVRIHASSR